MTKDCHTESPTDRIWESMLYTSPIQSSMFFGELVDHLQLSSFTFTT